MNVYIVLAVLCIIIVLIFVLLFSKKPKGHVPFVPNIENTDFDVELTGPTGPIVIPELREMYANLQELKISDFISTMIDPYLPYDKIHIFWKNIQIGNNNIEIQNGQITDSRKFSDLNIGENAKITASFSHTCLIQDKKTCNLCNGEINVCTENGWICQPKMQCPTGKDAQACCTDPNNPVASCVGNQIVCGTCQGTPNCGPPTCSGRGGVCTKDGWVCQDGVVCPTIEEAKSCCADPNQHPACNNGKIVCANCSGTFNGNCGPSCDLKGLVCDDNGNLQCVPGQEKCSSLTRADILSRNCCKDPTPYPYCGETSILCSACENIPPPDPLKCPQSCQGHGWKCTENGWECLPGVMCPNLNELNCCPSGYNQICDPTTKCVKCGCPSNSTACGSEKCSTLGVQSCCPAGTVCVANPITKEMQCCANAQSACFVNGKATCCPDGTMCQNNMCLSICGTDALGNPKTCQYGSTCVILSNVSQEKANLILSKDKDAVYDGKGTIYMCVPEQNTCSFVGNETTVPASINNFYPCYSFPSPTQAEGIQFCAGKNPADSLLCQKSHSNPTTCNNDAKCVWIDALEESSSGNNTTYLENVMTNIQGPYGQYCQNADQPLQRIATFQGNQNCGFQNCISQVIQPDVTDISFNDSTKMCSAVQNCVSNNSTISKSYRDPSTGKIVSDNGSIFTSGNVGTCNTSSCPVSDPYMCDPYNGRIVRKTYNCKSLGPGKGGQSCQLVGDGSGQFMDSNCGNNCHGPRSYILAQGNYAPFLQVNTDNDRLISDNGRYQFVIEPSSVYVIDTQTGQKTANWTGIQNLYTMLFQGDGNVVGYDINKNPLWQTQTVCPRFGTSQNTYFIMQDDGNAVLYSSQNQEYVLWDCFGNVSLPLICTG